MEKKKVWVQVEVNATGRPKLADKVTRLSVVVPEKLKNKVKRRAKAAGLSMSDYVREVLEGKQ